MSDPRQLTRLMAAVSESAWAITPGKLATLVSLLATRATGQRLGQDEIRAALATATAARPVRGVARGVAVLPLFGVIGPRMNMALDISGGTSTEQLTADFRTLVDDDRVSAIVLAVDSPGGSCHGIEECATQIRASRGRKPVVAAVSHLAASAAYWIAAQADRIVCTPSGDVGSIGVITAHDDLSAAQEQAGVKTTIVSAGKHKADANPFEPLSADARADLQRRVDQCYARFVADVAAGRGVSEATVREGYGQGRLLGSRDALAAGMVDEIATLDDVIAELATTAGAGAPTRSARATRQEPREAATRQEPALADWQQRVALDLRLLDL